MLQKPAGERASTPTDNILETIREALSGLRNTPAPAETPVTPLIISLGTPWYIGTKMRFVALSNGGALEVQDSGGSWIEQTRWTEA